MRRFMDGGKVGECGKTVLAEVEHRPRLSLPRESLRPIGSQALRGGTLHGGSHISVDVGGRIVRGFDADNILWQEESPSGDRQSLAVRWSQGLTRQLLALRP